MTFKQVLIAVRKLIASGKEKFICCAITRVCTNANGYKKDTDYIYRQRIQNQLDGCYNYDIWLHEKHPEINSYEHYGTPLYKKKAKKGRLDWIDHMIKQEEANEAISTISKV